MSPKQNKPPLALGMDFNEALHRFARVDPKEVKESIASKKTKPRRSEVKDT